MNIWKKLIENHRHMCFKLRWLYLKFSLSSLHCFHFHSTIPLQCIEFYIALQAKKLFWIGNSTKVGEKKDVCVRCCVMQGLMTSQFSHNFKFNFILKKSRNFSPPDSCFYPSSHIAQHRLQKIDSSKCNSYGFRGSKKKNFPFSSNSSHPFRNYRKTSEQLHEG